jgi:hypothetical protein
VAADTRAAVVCAVPVLLFISPQSNSADLIEGTSTTGDVLTVVAAVIVVSPVALRGVVEGNVSGFSAPGQSLEATLASDGVVKVEPGLTATRGAGADTECRASLIGLTGTASSTTAISPAVLAAAVGLAVLANTVRATGLEPAARATSTAAAIRATILATALRRAGSPAVGQTGPRGLD